MKPSRSKPRVAKSSLAKLILAAPLALVLAAAAPEPKQPVDLQAYAGKWYEIARLHNRPEDGCVDAVADYIPQPDGGYKVVQTCTRAQGPAKVYRASLKVLDPGMNAKFRLTFFPFVYKDYWILDFDHAQGWVVLGEPTGRYLWLFSRTPDISTHKAQVVARAKALGYDTSRLIYDKGA